MTKSRSSLPKVSRRQLLTGAAAGGGLLVAWWAWPRSYDPPLAPSEGEEGFGAWLTVGTDGVVTIAVPQLEMGQGVTTLLPQIIATEMGADWRQIAIVPAPPSGAQPNIPLAAKWAPLWSIAPDLAGQPDGWLPERFARRNRFTATAEGLSLEAYEADCRKAGAAARAMMAMAAAQEWGVAWEEVVISAGLVRHGEKQARFGELAAVAAQMTPPDPPPLRPSAPAEDPREFTGETLTAFPRLDLPAKVDGSLTFAADIRLPSMLYASVRHGPIGQPELARFDEEAAAKVPGVASIIKAKRWIAVVAENWWQAEQGCKALRPRFSGPGAVSSITIDEQMDDALSEGEAQRVHEIGEPDGLVGAPTMARAYSIATAHHASIETSCATAHYTEGKLHLWIASQAPEAARAAAADAIGISIDDVVLYPVAAGGSFDARLEKTHAIEVAQIAEQLGQPVQLTWPRAEEMKSLPPRMPVVIQLAAKLSPGEQRTPEHWQTRIACPPGTFEFGYRLFNNNTPEAAIRNASAKMDALACEGAVPPYAIPNVSVDHVPVELFLPTGRLRGNAYGYTAFANECFVDELAHGLGRDPLLYRIAMLGDDQRMAIALRRAAQLGGWDGGRPGTGQGIAMLRMETPSANSWSSDGYIACVARVRMVEGRPQVSSLHAVADIGRIVNLDLARQQIEGGLLFGVGLAMGSSAVWQNGQPDPSRLAGMNIPTLANAPEVTVDLIASDAPPFDPGELGVAVAPPAIANAFFALNGERIQSLPLFDSGMLNEAEPEEETEGGGEQSGPEGVEQSEEPAASPDDTAPNDQEAAEPA
ncbi:molybdopterin cofactor-binding domain-containing protein [Erythrobacter sp. W53]|uniref:xanthine dehydrogenase family protein molybdopterin-binding subunit n=1 Tax=Erythrobacter sp. W53 TaxID=3425947 RepID=UPI003D767061